MSPSSRRKGTNDRGTYALVLNLPRAQIIRIGALGSFKFPRGYYLYIGSAMNGMAARIARHLSHDKKKHWHIDYFLERARAKEIWTHQGSERFECEWAQAALALPNAKTVAPRFGASDCRCPTHLIHFGKHRMKDEG